MTGTVVAAISTAEQRLAGSGCDAPRVDAELLLAHVLGTNRAGLYAESRRSLTTAEQRRVESLVARRERREPLAYILGEWGFRRLSLEVDRRVLVPRPETEIVVERALARIEGLADPRVLDVGTGSGAIALAVADEHDGARVTGVDSSPGALAVARRNADRLGLAVDLVHWDLFDGLPEGPWDLVVSNPPLRPACGDRAARAGGSRVGAAGGARRRRCHRGDRARRAQLAALRRRAGAGDIRVGCEPDRAAPGRLGYDEIRISLDLAGRERVVECTRR